MSLPFPPHWIEKTTEENRNILQSFLSTLQKSQDFEPFDSEDEKGFVEFVEEVGQIDRFYASIGGIAGYYQKVASFLEGKQERRNVDLFSPPMWNLREKNALNILFGLTSLPLTGEIYPLGGAGDRLSLPLPAACLPFLGQNLLEGLIRDLQAKEFLFFKLFEKSIMTPVALMTSDEKENHDHIDRLLRTSNWFGRPPTHFHLFKQPQAPLISLEGEWVFSKPWKLAMKPGGHGLIWKLAREEGVFDWFEKLNRSKVLVRQINNPVAGVDGALLSFLGIGVMEEKGFGFLSCPRRVGAPEGINLLTKDEHKFCLTSIEYTDFDRWGIVDEPESPGSLYSKYPSNTNILFGDLAVLKELSVQDPFPGLLLNPKTKVASFSRKGPDPIEKSAGRLETLMQAVGNLLFSPNKDHLPSFIAYNDRQKTISPTKKSYEAGKGIEDTPEGAYFDLLSNSYQLLKEECQVELPLLEWVFGEQVKPPFIFHYHPALGPLFSLISQKIFQGTIHPDSEIDLEIAEFYMNGFDVQGSLLVRATNPLGLQSHAYTNRSGKCLLENVVVRNRGIDFDAPHCCWKREVVRQEALEIVLEGDSFFEARDVEFVGPHKIIVPDGYHYRMIGSTLEKLKLEGGQPLFKYGLNDAGEIKAELHALEMKS